MQVSGGDFERRELSGSEVVPEKAAVPPKTLLLKADFAETDTTRQQLEPHDTLVINALLAARERREGWCARSEIYEYGFAEGVKETTRNTLVTQARENIARITYGQPPKSIIEHNGRVRGGARIRLQPELTVRDERTATDAQGEAFPEVSLEEQGVSLAATEAEEANEATEHIEDHPMEDDQNATPDTSETDELEVKDVPKETDEEKLAQLNGAAQQLIASEAADDRKRLDDDKLFDMTSLRTTSPPRRSSRRPKAGKETSFTEDPVRLYLQEIGRHPMLTREGEIYLARTIEAGQQASLILEDDQASSLSLEDQVALKRMVRSAAEAEKTFIQTNLRLVVSVAKRYQSSGLPLLDLIQEGNFGLIHAVHKFDWRKGFKFSTYATWWIRQSITRGIADTNRTIRLPVHVQDTLDRVRKEHTKFFSTHGREPTLHELSARTHLPVDKLEVLVQVADDAVSLNTRTSDRYDNLTELGDMVQDKEAVSTEDAAIGALMPAMVSNMLIKLSDERERAILQMRYGLDGGGGATLEEVGSRFSLTRERIRQIESRALARLRHPSGPGSILRG